MDKLKSLLSKAVSGIGSLMPWMGPITWMGTFAFSFGFFVGSEGEWEGTLFFAFFWVVGAFIGHNWYNMRNK
jgi:hypothetical protein